MVLCRLDVIDILLEYKAEVNAKNNLDWTPLHSATQRGDYTVVSKLLQHGIEIFC